MAKKPTTKSIKPLTKGKPMVKMMAPNLPSMLTVSSADIKNGTPGDPCECAIAQTLKRLFPTAENVYVTDETPSFNIDIPLFSTKGAPVDKINFLVTLSLPEKVNRFIQQYDNADDEFNAKGKPLNPCKPTSFKVMDITMEVNE